MITVCMYGTARKVKYAVIFVLQSLKSYDLRVVFMFIQYVLTLHNNFIYIMHLSITTKIIFIISIKIIYLQK